MVVKDRFDVMVAGAGVVGLAAAIAMRQRSYDVALIDKKPLEDTHAATSRVYAINRASQAFLTTLGVWHRLDSKQQAPYQRMHVWDRSNGAHIDFDARLKGEDRLGTIVTEAGLKEILLKKAQAIGIHFFPSHEIEDIAINNDVVIVSGKSYQYHAPLLCIADGANSLLRTKLKVAMTVWPYHQQAIVATVQTAKPHQSTAYQVFTADGPLAFLPLASSHQCSIVWSMPTAKAQCLQQVEEASFNQQLTEAFSQKLGEVELIDKRYTFPLLMRHTQQYSGDKWLLLGDAAHTIHPLAGLGLNIGLADVMAWLTQLDTFPNRAMTKQLKAYQRQRKHAVWQTIILLEGLKALFANPLLGVKQLRHLGLQCSNHSTLLKRLFIDYAG